MRLALIDPACEVTVPENLQARIPSRSFREPLGIGSSGPQSHSPLQEPESRCGRLEAVCPSEQGPSSSKGPSDLYCDASSSLSPGGPDGSCDSSFSSGIGVFTPAR